MLSSSVPSREENALLLCVSGSRGKTTSCEFFHAIYRLLMEEGHSSKNGWEVRKSQFRFFFLFQIGFQKLNLDALAGG